MVIFDDLKLDFGESEDAIKFNRERIYEEKQRVSDLLAHLRRLEKANQAFCKHPKEHQVGEYCQYTDGSTTCTLCGATW